MMSDARAMARIALDQKVKFESCLRSARVTLR